MDLATQQRCYASVLFNQNVLVTKQLNAEIKLRNQVKTQKKMPLCALLTVFPLEGDYLFWLGINTITSVTASESALIQSQIPMRAQRLPLHFWE